MPEFSVTSPNFGFLEPYQPLLVRYAALAERYVFDDPNTCLIKLRQFIELLASLVAAELGVEVFEKDELRIVLGRLEASRRVSLDVLKQFHMIRQAGNTAAHEHRGNRTDALFHLRIAHLIAKWFWRTFREDGFHGRAFVPPPTPREPSHELTKELARIRDETSRTLAEERERRVQAERLVMEQTKVRDASVAEASLRAQKEAESRILAESKARWAAEQSEELRRWTEEARKAYGALTDAISRADESESKRLKERAEFEEQIKTLRAEVSLRDAGTAERLNARARTGYDFPKRGPKKKTRRLWQIAGVIGLAGVAAGGWSAFVAMQAASPRPPDGQAAAHQNTDTSLPSGESRGAIVPASDVHRLRASEGQVVRVEGKVQRAHLVPSGKVLYLNFGVDYKNCLKAKVFEKSFDRWLGGRSAIESAYVGRVIRLQGVVVNWQGSPEITIDSPTDVEIVSPPSD